MRRRARISLGLLVVEATRAVRRHRVRSFLTSVGITIGIAAVVWVVAIGRAGSARAEAQLLALGDNLVWIEAGSRNVAGVRTGARGTTTLTIDDVEAMRSEIPELKSVSPNIDGAVLVIHGTHNWTTGYGGVYPDYLDIKRRRIAEGESFNDSHVTLASNVCLLGETTRRQLFGDEPAVGQTVRIGAQVFEVLGILERKGQNANGRDQDDFILLPYTTAQQKIRGKGVVWLDDIMASARSPEDIAAAITRIVALLRERHRIVGEDDDFNIRRPEEVLKAQVESDRAFALLLVSVASVALLVGGVGVMNVMLASVAERTREIGVRLAVGATPGAVRMQFLVEAVVLSLVGGLAGIAVSFAGASVLEDITEWSIPIPPSALGLALAFSASVGVVFGLYPAWRASMLDPIEALRSE